MNLAAIETSGLSKRYPGGRGVADLDLTVQRGEIFGFLGPNGAGKTTTMKMILDLIRPTSGTIRVLGLDPVAQGAELRAQLGYLPGELVLDGSENVGELLGFFARLQGNVDQTWVTELADRLELDRSRKVKNLSKGNKQKVGIVQAFMHRPALLVLDEPTSGLDPLMQQVFLNLVTEAKTNGQTVFMSSHILSEVQEVADRVAIIKDGRLVTISTVAALQQQAVSQVEIRFAESFSTEDFVGLEHVGAVRADGHTLHCTVDGSVDALVKQVARYRVEALFCQKPDLESIFMDEYVKEGAPVVH
ncbi:ABC transporter ATP-binding protein [Streptomyces sp. NL15-2K]|uniref:ABC transporter ATP-binding protein n=1 Tax=Streptomyces sp. NL15-2K TaxID=376149 RepID=UPI000F567910|nr:MULTISPECIES: ABC transporter ATP-binding protein [Actinomycetes]WKX13890.1 ABC transporter ATP-binding protein [Kutzneria buriramensis]GCB52032.1 ABC transporter [Streptomyces sp. NL15-2K]